MTSVVSRACVAALVAGPLACTEPSPVAFPMRTTVPIAEWDIRVIRREVSHNFLPSPVTQLHAMTGADKLLAIHADCRYERGEPDRQEADLRRLLANLSVVNASGKSTSLLMAPLPESHFNMMKTGITNPGAFQSMQDLQYMQSLAQGAKSDAKRGRWVLLFAVRSEADSLSLRIRNYAPTEDQPEVALVSLRR